MEVGRCYPPEPELCLSVCAYGKCEGRNSRIKKALTNSEDVNPNGNDQAYSNPNGNMPGWHVLVPIADDYCRRRQFS